MALDKNIIHYYNLSNTQRPIVNQVFTLAKMSEEELRDKTNNNSIAFIVIFCMNMKIMLFA